MANQPLFALFQWWESHLQRGFCCLEQLTEKGFLFVYSVSQFYLLSTYYVRGTVSCTVDTTVNETNVTPTLIEFTV